MTTHFGIPFDSSLIDSLRINTSAIEKRCQEITARRTVKKEWQAAWLVQMIRLLDLTTLSGDDTPERVRRLCRKALSPLSPDMLSLLSQLGVEDIHVGAVCVYNEMVATAVAALQNQTKGKRKKIPVAAVATGFPAGLSGFKTKKEEIRQAVKAGASEIDVVITRAHVLGGKWHRLYREIQEYRECCGPAHLKVILGVGDIRTLNQVARAAWTAMMAGADFIKTSTGKEGVNATLPYALVMLRAIREYQEVTGIPVGFKPAGGISTTKAALPYMYLIKEELGDEWLTPERFRLGASSLLNDIERQLFHYCYGDYSAGYYHPLT